MTTLTMRLVKGDFIVTGPDIAPMKFKSRPEARDWCKTPAYHGDSPGGKRGARTSAPRLPAAQGIGRQPAGGAGAPKKSPARGTGQKVHLA